MDYEALFDAIHPGFFREPRIAALPEDRAFVEMALDLRGEPPTLEPARCPDGIAFGVYPADAPGLRNAVERVNRDWTRYFTGGERAFCATADDAFVAFCLLSDMGRHQGLHVCGPGCVGTVPERRRQGVGLEMVRRATELLRREGCDLSWIHYTRLERWYGRLGYRTVLRWNCRGFLPDGEDRP